MRIAYGCVAGVGLRATGGFAVVAGSPFRERAVLSLSSRHSQNTPLNTEQRGAAFHAQRKLSFLVKFSKRALASEFPVFESFAQLGISPPLQHIDASREPLGGRPAFAAYCARREHRLVRHDRSAAFSLTTCD